MSNEIAYKTKFLTAYDKEGKTNIKALKHSGKQSGVYFIKKPGGAVAYVGYSKTQLYKTVYRHFQEWNDKKQKRYQYPKNYLVRIIFTTPARAEKLEEYLIKKLRPEDNKDKYEYFTQTKAAEATAVETLNEAADIDNIEDPF